MKRKSKNGPLGKNQAVSLHSAGWYVGIVHSSSAHPQCEQVLALCPTLRPTSLCACSDACWDACIDARGGAARSGEALVVRHCRQCHADCGRRMRVSAVALAFQQRSTRPRGTAGAKLSGALRALHCGTLWCAQSMAVVLEVASYVFPGDWAVPDEWMPHRVDPGRILQERTFLCIREVSIVCREEVAVAVVRVRKALSLGEVRSLEPVDLLQEEK